MIKLLSKFLHLSWREKRCLLLAFVVLHVIRFGLWRRSFKALWCQIKHDSDQPAPWVQSFLPVPPPVSELVQAIDSASWYTLKPARCLSRALTLYLLMKWFKYTPTLRIGVAKPQAISSTSETTSKVTPPPKIDAHAWVEYQGQVILGQISDLGRFTPLPSIEHMDR